MPSNTPSYLHQSPSGRYYLRVAVPRQLLPYWQGREVKCSLKTYERPTALRRARRLVVELDILFTQVSHGHMTYKEAKARLEAYLAQELEKVMRHLEVRGPLTLEEKERFKVGARTHRNIATFDWPTSYAEKIVAKVFKDEDLKPETPQYERLAVAATRMVATLLDTILARNAELESFAPPQTPTAAAGKPPDRMLPLETESTRLTELVERYCTEKRREESWTPKTELANRGMYSLLTKILGDRTVAVIGHAEAREYKRILQLLPPNLDKSSKYRGKPIHEIIESKPAALMSVITVNNHLNKVSSLFDWAERHGYVSKNVFSKLSLKNPKRVDEARAPFDEDDLKAIFSTPMYRHRRYKHPFQYWLPLMGLHTGARINELCQLHVADIRQDDGVWVFDINTASPDKHLKSKAARRLVPVHPKLIELGLLDFIEHVRARGETKLFPELKASRDGTGQAASRWFARYRKKLGLYRQTPKKDFHSFRTTLINTLKQKGLPEPQVAALVGHSVSGITYERYGKAYHASMLLEVISQADFSKSLEELTRST